MTRDRRRARAAAPPTASRSKPSSRAEPTATARGGGRAVPPAPAVRRDDAQHRHLRAVRRAPAAGLRVPAVQLPRRRGQRRAATATGATSRSTSSPRIDAIDADGRRRLPIALVGWSFGADMALSVADPRVAGWVGDRAAAALPTAVRGRRHDAAAEAPRARASTTSSATPRERAARGRGVDERDDRGRRRARVTSSSAAPTASSRRRSRHSLRVADALSGERATTDERCGREAVDARGTSPGDSTAVRQAARSSLEVRAVAVFVCVLELVERAIFGIEKRSVAAEEVVVDRVDRSVAPFAGSVSRAWHSLALCRAPSPALGPVTVPQPGAARNHLRLRPRYFGSTG